MVFGEMNTRLQLPPSTRIAYDVNNAGTHPTLHGGGNSADWYERM
jgi:hypothetical protein